MSARDEATRAGMVADIEEMDRIIGQFLDFARDDGVTRAGDEATSTRSSPHRVDRYARAGRDVEFPRGELPSLALRATAMLAAHGEPDRQRARLWRAAGRGVDVVLRRSRRARHRRSRRRYSDVRSGAAEAAVHACNRARAARGDGAAGAGLGLAIVDRIARMHGGRFDLAAARRRRHRRARDAAAAGVAQERAISRTGGQRGDALAAPREPQSPVSSSP